MNFQFTHPHFLWLLIPAIAWVVWLTLKSDVGITKTRKWIAFAVRLVVLIALIFAIAGLQFRRPIEGMNVFFLLDRSDSIPSTQQEGVKNFINRVAREKEKPDKAGVLVFGTDAAIESSANAIVDVQKINAVVGPERTDIASAIRLGSAAFPETGQKRLVLLSDGNENMGDAMAAVLAARNLGVTIDVVPLGVERGNDVSVQKLGVPNRVKEGQTFEAKIFVQADAPQAATVRLYRNDAVLGEQRVQLSAGKNLFTFPQTLTDPGFYSYTVQVDTIGDAVPQNNKATSFVTVRGDPQVLIVSADKQQDAQLAAALGGSRLRVRHVALDQLPTTLAEMQSYDTIFISNLAAGDLGMDTMRLLESAVRDFGVGLVCIGGDQTYAAGGYRGTPLEATLPVNMELDSKKVLPSGAIALVMHGMEFANGNQVARDCAQGVLAALGPNDELGVVLWDGFERWLFPLTKVGDRKALGRQIAGMNQGDLPAFTGVMTKAYEALKASTANLKHMIVFSDGDPGAPTQQLMQAIVGARITVSTVLISGHAGPDTMTWIADQGRGRFYNVQNAGQLPQIFIKETAVILKSAIFEEPFKPKMVAASEIVRGISGDEMPNLLGYVCTTAKPRAETPIVSDKGDPVLAHWQYGLGRSVAFTSDAKARWARNWLSWGKYRQFWSQAAQWSLRRLENADYTTDINIDRGQGQLTVEALDEKGDYRNFLNLQAVVVSPKGGRQTVRLEQTGPGHYEVNFPTKEIGSYLVNLMEIKDGRIAGSQSLGASINYSPEFTAPEPNVNLLKRIADTGRGKFLDPLNVSDNPFLHDRKKTYQPRDLWEWLLKLAIILFVIDVAIRRIQIDRDEWARAFSKIKVLWRGKPRPATADEGLAALLARRDKVRADRDSTHPDIQPSTHPSEARPDLFRPTTPVSPGAPPTLPSERPAFTPAPEEAKPADAPTTTTSRLLEAKRRAQKRKE